MTSRIIIKFSGHTGGVWYITRLGGGGGYRLTADLCLATEFAITSDALTAVAKHQFDEGYKFATVNVKRAGGTWVFMRKATNYQEIV